VYDRESHVCSNVFSSENSIKHPYIVYDPLAATASHHHMLTSVYTRPSRPIQSTTKLARYEHGLAQKLADHVGLRPAPSHTHLRRVVSNMAQPVRPGPAKPGGGSGLSRMTYDLSIKMLYNIFLL
jgi:hypothetical protein